MWPEKSEAKIVESSWLKGDAKGEIVCCGDGADLAAVGVPQ